MKRHLPCMAAGMCVCACLVLMSAPFYTLYAGSEVSETILRENLLPARQGDPQAQVFVGYLYETGQGVERNYVTAAAWYRKAAEQGNTIAQAQLGTMYRLGKGVPQNCILAYMWYSLAIQGGNRSARELKSQVAVLMSPAEIAEAKRMAGGWEPSQR